MSEPASFEQQEAVFGGLRRRLNAAAEAAGELRLQVPFVTVRARRAGLPPRGAA